MVLLNQVGYILKHSALENKSISDDWNVLANQIRWKYKRRQSTVWGSAEGMVKLVHRVNKELHSSLTVQSVRFDAIFGIYDMIAGLWF